MKKIIFINVFILMLNSILSAQQRPSGIKVLVKDKETGFSFINDSMVVIFNDSVKQQFVSDQEGYAFFSLAPGRYSVEISHVSYQGAKIWGIVVGEAKTAYVTMELSNQKGDKIRKKKKKGGVKLKPVKN